MLEDEVELEVMGQRSRARVAGNYLWSDVADAYETLLEGLC